MRSRTLVVVLCSLAWTGVAAPARASTLAYQCGDEICGIDPDGGAPRALTSGGTAASPDRFGTLSRDGRTLSWERGSTILTASPPGAAPVPVPGGDQAGAALRMSPAGDAWLWHQQVPIGGSSSDDTYLLRAGQPADSVAVNAETSGWLGASPLGAYRVADKDPATPPSQVCVLDASSARCPRLVLSDPTRLLSFPDGSPDGQLVAVAAEPEPAGTQSFGGVIAVYSASSGALVRDLTSGTADSVPSFSPDGAQLAFQRDGGIWVVPVAGGTPRRVADGVNPSWGGDVSGPAGPGADPAGGPVATPRVTASPVACRVSARRCVLRGTATTGAGVDVAVQRRRGGGCEAWTGRRWAAGSCSATRLVRARRASGGWTLTLRGLRRGTMRVTAQAAFAGAAPVEARRTVRVR